MATDPKQVMRNLKTDIGRDFQSMTGDLHNNLKSNTPTRTGRARAGWRNTYRNQLFKNEQFEVERNMVEYIGVLDQGTSTQAPQGIVQPAMRKTRRLT